MAQHQGRLATRFNSMMQERPQSAPPPLGRNPEGERLPMPQPRARPNGAERRAKYYSRLAADLDDYAQTGEARNPHRTTRLWEEFLPQAGQEEYRSRRHAREADRLNQARGGGPRIAAIGSSRRVMPDQGGTRKVVAIAMSLDYVVPNLPAVTAAMHARLGLARAGPNPRAPW